MGQNLPVARFARMWSELIVTGEAELADLPAHRYLPLSYTDLVADARLSLARLASFLDVEADPKWLEFGTSVIDPRFTGASNRLSPEELQAVIASSAPAAARLAEHAVATGANEVTA
jgi:hypothetical protein